MQSLSEKIQDICTYANQAQNEFHPDKPEYHKYTQAFSELLRSKTSHIDPEKQEIIDEIVSIVFIAYDDMTEGPKKLALYIKNLVTQLEADPNYLRHWSIQSVIDAFVDPQDLTSSDSYLPLEEYVSQIGNELDEEINRYNQKSADYIPDSGLLDDEDADEDLERFLNEDTQALNAQPENLSSDSVPNSPKMIRTASQDSDHTSTESASVNRDQASPFSEMSSNASADVSFSSENEVSAEFLAEFSIKFDAIIKKFRAKFDIEPILGTDRETLHTTTKHVINTLIESYKICFDKTVSTETLAEFDTLTQSIINHWSYANDTDLSEMSTAIATQAFAKLELSLMRLTEETRQDERLNPPRASLDW